MPINIPDSAFKVNPVSRQVTRNTIKIILQTALEEKEYRFARQAALSWLSIYPGDIEVNRILADVFAHEGKIGQSIQILERICRLDPEDMAAQKELANLYGEAQPEDYQRILVNIYVLGERVDPSVAMPGWSTVLRNTRQALIEGNLEAAETMVYQVLALKQDEVLVGLTHLEVIRELGDESNLVKFAELYNSRWPDCLLFKLALAEVRLDSGDESSAVTLLHQCVAADAAGQVSQRWWGGQHHYRPLWPEKLETSLEIAVPASIAARLGWNRLPHLAELPQPESLSEEVDEHIFEKILEEEKQVQAAARKEKPSRLKNGQNLPQPSEPKNAGWLKDAEVELEKLAKRMKTQSIANMDGRLPIFVVFSTRSGLNSQYGLQSTSVLLKEMELLADAVRKRPGWGAMVFCPDDIETTGKLGMKTTATIDPWKLKLALVDLDKALARKGSRVGAVLIVGGSEVVPFHKLPNPTDDSDEEVLSDNPYATRDSNYFVPEWPVGRLTGEKGADTGLLLQQLRQSTRYHGQVAQGAKSIQRVSWIINFIRLLLRSRQTTIRTSSFGYSASVWRRSSLATFRPVGEGKSLLVSPPTATGEFNYSQLVGSQLGFYNLHGLPDTAEWYGQRDAHENSSLPEYPVALSLKDLPKNGKSPKIVFSEACYGGYVQEKSEQTSIAMRFLSIGTMAVVGSTGIAYGSVATPLVGADLLGFLFWNTLREGYSVGEALCQAKINMVQEMNRRQGFLDGEDQKTLISFVLYGDPLIYHDGVQISPKKFVRQQHNFVVKTISDQQMPDRPLETISEKALMQAKQAVECYLPGIDRADVSVNSQKIEMEGKMHRGEPAVSRGRKMAEKQLADRTVVIFRKKVQIGNTSHYQYARVTMDSSGKIAKMALSR